MKFLKIHDSTINGFDAAGFLKEYKHRSSVISSLKRRLSDLEESGVSAIRYDKDKVQTSNLSNPTEELALVMLHVERQIAYYEFWQDACDDALGKMDKDECWILREWYIKGCSLMDAIEHLNLERTSVFNFKKRALEHFADLLIGMIKPPFVC